MRGLLIILIICGLIFLVSVVFPAIMTGTGRWNRSFRRIGERFGVPIRPGTFFKSPILSFRYGESDCMLRCRSSRRRHGGNRTELVCSWPDPKMKLEIRRREEAPRLRSMRNLPMIETGETEFDQRFVIQSNQVRAAQNLMSSGVQWQVEQLARHLHDDSVYISIHRGRMTVSKPNYIKDFEPLDDFVRFSLELLDQALLTRSVGIDFVNAESPTLIEKISCPICCEEITGDMVICVRCKTPHCRDCWLYNGQCAMFACGETRFATPTAGGPAR